MVSIGVTTGQEMGADPARGELVVVSGSAAMGT